MPGTLSPRSGHEHMEHRVVELRKVTCSPKSSALPFPLPLDESILKPLELMMIAHSFNTAYGAAAQHTLAHGRCEDSPAHGQLEGSFAHGKCGGDQQAYKPHSSAVCKPLFVSLQDGQKQSHAPCC